MSTLLEHISGNRLLNMTIFRPHIYVFDDRIVYKRRHILTHDELSVTYNHISQVDLYRYILFFAHVDIITTGQQKIAVRWANKRSAVRVKKIVDEKMFQSHRKRASEANEEPLIIKDYELSLKRLKELVNTGRITEHEFKKRQKQLLKKHY